MWGQFPASGYHFADNWAWHGIQIRIQKKKKKTGLGTTSRGGVGEYHAAPHMRLVACKLHYDPLIPLWLAISTFHAPSLLKWQLWAPFHTVPCHLGWEHGGLIDEQLLVTAQRCLGS